MPLKASVKLFKTGNGYLLNLAFIVVFDGVGEQSVKQLCIRRGST